MYIQVLFLLKVTKYIYSRRGNIVSSPFVSVKAFGDACRLMDVRLKSHVFFIYMLRGTISCKVYNVNFETVIIVMIETTLMFVLLLYVFPVIVCVAWSKLWGDPITYKSYMPIINLTYVAVFFCIFIISILALIIERFPYLIYNYKKILKEIRRK